MTYSQSTNEDWFRVSYTIEPDFSKDKFFIGDEIHINAIVTNKCSYWTDGGVFDLLKNFDLTRFTILLNNEEVYSEVLNIPYSYNSDGIQFKRVDAYIKIPKSFNRQIIAYLRFKADFHRQYSSGLPGQSDYTKYTVVSQEQSFKCAGVSYDIIIDAFKFSRVSLKNDEYIIDNQGKYIICENFSITVNNDIIVSDFEIKKIRLSSGDDLIVEKDLELSILESAMAEGYSEVSPSLFEGYELILSKIYRIDLILGNENEVLITKTAFLYSGYANMHLSGAKQGGVAFGGFSTATDENPLFESYFPATFYKGLTDISLKMFSNALYPVGAIFICAGETDPNIIFGGEWERLDNVYLYATNEGIGEKGGSETITISNLHNHVAPIGVQGGYVGAVEVESGLSEVITSDKARYATAKVDSSGNITNDIRYYYTGYSYAGGSTKNDPPHLNVAMWERKTLYDIEQDVDAPVAAIRQINMKRLEAAK